MTRFLQICDAGMQRVAALTLACLLLAACREGRVPHGFGPLALGEPEHCPIVNGRFDALEPLVRWSVVERVLPYDSTRLEVEGFSLQGNADQSLQLVAWSSGEPFDTVQLARARHYRCDEGRLVLDLPERLPEGSGEEPAHSERLVRANRLALAIGAEGALVAELARETYSGIAVWCGDGCKYVPVPFSGQTTHSWLRVYPMPLGEVARARRVAPPSEQQLNDRMAAEEKALEEGRPVPDRGAQRQWRAQAEARERAVEMGAPPR
jgi:hypothetical protein